MPAFLVPQRLQSPSPTPVSSRSSFARRRLAISSTAQPNTAMEEHALARARRSQRLLAKPRLDPHCAVFPDPLRPPSPPPPPTNSRPSPVHLADSQYDYFGWRAAKRPHQTPDLSCPAPVGALGDAHSGEHGVQLGAWYAFSKGFQSELGSAIFADQAPSTMRGAARRRRVREQYQHGQPCYAECDRWQCACHDPAVGRWGYTYVSDAEPEEDEEDDDDDYSDAADDRSSLGQSDSDDTCDHYLWNRRTPHCVVNSVSPASSLATEVSQGDITAEQAANGMDVQGIPWESLPFSREDYRATRLRESTRRDCPDYAEGLRAVLKEPRRGAQFYNFFKNTRRIKCSIVHFQLRNLAWATSKHDVFVMHEGAVVHWDAAAKRKTQVLDLSGSGTSSANGLGMVQISTMIAKDDLVIAGGFYGEMVAKNLKTGSIIHNKRITYDENAITNAIDIFQDSIMTSNNDCYVRCFDMATFQRKSAFGFDKPVNHATRQPEGKMVAVAGDSNPVHVIDGNSGERITQLHGHEDFSFATGWHPNGRMFATGSQDRTCRVWDVRNMSQSFSVLGAHTGAVRSLRFSACGRFLAMAEPRDYVHIFDVNRGEFDTCQEIDLFGEIAGIALTPSAEGLFIAVSDRTYSSLIEYERKCSSPLADLIF